MEFSRKTYSGVFMTLLHIYDGVMDIYGCKRSMIDERLIDVDCFHKKAQSYMFEGVLNKPLIIIS